MSLADAAKTPVTEVYQTSGVLPTSNTTANYAGAVGKYTASVDVGKAGVITATADKANSNSAVQGKTITLTPATDTTGVLIWTCGGTVDATYRPSSCK
ncbi:pilin [Pseudomonas sp. AK106]